MLLPYEFICNEKTVSYDLQQSDCLNDFCLVMQYGGIELYQ